MTLLAARTAWKLFSASRAFVFAGFRHNSVPVSSRSNLASTVSNDWAPRWTYRPPVIGIHKQIHQLGAQDAFYPGGQLPHHDPEVSSGGEKIRHQVCRPVLLEQRRTRAALDIVSRQGPEAEIEAKQGEGGAQSGVDAQRWGLNTPCVYVHG